MSAGPSETENPGVPVLFGGHNLPPLVEIGLTDLPKSGTKGLNYTSKVALEVYKYTSRSSRTLLKKTLKLPSLTLYMFLDAPTHLFR